MEMHQLEDMYPALDTVRCSALHHLRVHIRTQATIKIELANILGLCAFTWGSGSVCSLRSICLDLDYLPFRDISLHWNLLRHRKKCLLSEDESIFEERDSYGYCVRTELWDITDLLEFNLGGRAITLRLYYEHLVETPEGPYNNGGERLVRVRITHGTYEVHISPAFVHPHINPDSRDIYNLPARTG